MGIECQDGFTCFTGIFCPATTLPPSPEPTSSPIEAFTIVPTPAPIATNTQFCGFNYTDAFDSCDSERACPLGIECTGGLTCFAGITCPVKNVTYPPTPAPTARTHYCGANWTDAVENCSEDRACPSGFGCANGMTCYIIGDSCSALSGSDSPTPVPIGNSSSPTTKTIDESASPTPVPTSITRFCGASMFEAWYSCSAATACPNGNECGDGKACFQDITCPSSSITPTPAPNHENATARPSIRGSSTSAPATASPSTTNLLYCGSSPEDAADNCSVNTPCPDGTAHVCSAGQTCFPIPHVCDMSTSPPSTALTGQPTRSSSAGASFCGANWNDAKENCFTATPCTPGSVGECPGDQGCFEGIVDCQAPNITGSAFFDPYGQEPSHSSGGDAGYGEYSFGTNPNYIKSSSNLSWRRSNVALVVAGVAGVIVMAL